MVWGNTRYIMLHYQSVIHTSYACRSTAPVRASSQMRRPEESRFERDGEAMEVQPVPGLEVPTAARHVMLCHVYGA